MNNKEIELKDFISQTINPICDGIKDAKEYSRNTNNNNMPVAPATVGNRQVTTEYTIDFDISVTSSNTSSSDGSVGIKTYIFASAGKTNSNETSHINRIKFSVPYVPQGIIPKSLQNAKLI